MNKILKIAVNGHKMERSGDVAGASGSYNAVTLALTFDRAWDGTTKTVFFFNSMGENPVSRVLTADLLENGAYLLPIPAEPMAYCGHMTLTVRGIELSAARTERIVVSASTTLKVLDAKTPNPGAIPDLTPTEAERIQHQIDKMLADITTQADRAATGAATATEKAMSAASDAEAAKAEADKAAADAIKTAADRLVVESAAVAENGRATAEKDRSTAEQARATEETKRNAAEGNRATAETGRNDAEKLRESTTAGIVVRATEQANLATDKAALASSAQKSAGESAALAQKAVGDVGWGYFQPTAGGHIQFVRNDVGHPPAFSISKITGKMEVLY
ncbi:MAG: hypothetical protein RR365_11950 [Bacteroides sp.]